MRMPTDRLSPIDRLRQSLCAPFRSCSSLSSILSLSLSLTQPKLAAKLKCKTRLACKRLPSAVLRNQSANMRPLQAKHISASLAIFAIALNDTPEGRAEPQVGALLSQRPLFARSQGARKGLRTSDARGAIASARREDEKEFIELKLSIDRSAIDKLIQ